MENGDKGAIEVFTRKYELVSYLRGTDFSLLLKFRVKRFRDGLRGSAVLLNVLDLVADAT
ncbi:hypothetical protein [Saccharothrix sp. HUAS TT1]|uniref:hypothetical protein n=1 Tax=unclassified Saccharothrix TaxID=2593673 RepID=UPI00345BCCCB